LRFEAVVQAGRLGTLPIVQETFRQFSGTKAYGKNGNASLWQGRGRIRQPEGSPEVRSRSNGKCGFIRADGTELGELFQQTPLWPELADEEARA
jgi:hypothetical protein